MTYAQGTNTGFYVTAKYQGKTAYLLGPYPLQSEAARHDRRAVELAGTQHRDAHWFEYGTARLTMKNGRALPDGKFNGLLGKREPAFAGLTTNGGLPSRPAPFGVNEVVALASNPGGQIKYDLRRVAAVNRLRGETGFRVVTFDEAGQLRTDHVSDFGDSETIRPLASAAADTRVFAGSRGTKEFMRLAAELASTPVSARIQRSQARLASRDQPVAPRPLAAVVDHGPVIVQSELAAAGSAPKHVSSEQVVLF